MDERRQRRVADAIRDELSELVIYELADPRVSLTGITDVHLSPDGRKADVLIRTEGGAKAQQETLNALEHASPFLRRELTKRLSLRQVPDLRFRPDSGTASSERMDVLLKEAQKWRRKVDRKSTEPGKTEGTQ